MTQAASDQVASQRSGSGPALLSDGPRPAIPCAHHPERL